MCALVLGKGNELNDPLEAYSNMSDREEYEACFSYLLYTISLFSHSQQVGGFE